KIVAEDAEGRELERWELVSFTAPKTEVPPLDKGWNVFLVLDLRDQERATTPPLVKVLQGLRLNDWASLDRALAAALKSQPDQPFLLLVKAWSLAQRENGNEAEIVDLLKHVARTGTTELLRP